MAGNSKALHDVEIKYEPHHVECAIKYDPAVQKELQEILGKLKVVKESVHDKGKNYLSPDSLTFYRFFISKYISILQGKAENPQNNTILDKYASIFPFKTDASLPTSETPVSRIFDEGFLIVIETFVDDHFGDEFDSDHLIQIFLTNIEHFKGEHFQSPPSLKQLTRITSLGADTGDSPPEHLSDYLDDFFRLNDDGAEWYQYFQAKFNKLCRIYKRDLTLPNKSKTYMKYLPEINCCELLLLLEPAYFRTNRGAYTGIFQKYLFFFANSLRNPELHVVFFIDETLFSCLKSKREYETFAGDIMDLRWELWMITLIFCRSFALPQKKLMMFDIDDRNLRNVVDYVRQIPGIESGLLYYTEPQQPKCKIFSLLGDVEFCVGYYKISPPYYFAFSPILRASVLSRKIKKILFYNPSLGQVSSLEVPSKRKKILDFISKHNKQITYYPEKFLVREFAKYFDTIPASIRQYLSADD